jgi:aryl-alcohol dehydrogenase-like predicted oxidoreductase
VQLDYSVFSRDVEGPEGTNLLQACREAGVAVVVACPLGRGMISSEYSSGQGFDDDQDARPKMMPRFQEENRRHNEQVVKRFAELAQRKGCSVPQLALAWLLKQGDDIFPIPGTKRVKYLEDNWGALDITLSNEEDAEIKAFSNKNAIAGGVVPEMFRSWIYRDTREETA